MTRNDDPVLWPLQMKLNFGNAVVSVKFILDLALLLLCVSQLPKSGLHPAKPPLSGLSHLPLFKYQK